MKLGKLTTLFVVDTIEACLPEWHALGYSVAMRVPDEGPAAFAILSGPAADVMMQTRASLAEDLPPVAARNPSHTLYGDVASLAEAAAALVGSTVLVPKRTTFYGANEIWFLLEGDLILGLAERAG